MNGRTELSPTAVGGDGSSGAAASASSGGGGGGVTSPRTKRVRTIFSADQLERLEAEFARQQYMVGPERLLLAASLRLTESQVMIIQMICKFTAIHYHKPQ